MKFAIAALIGAASTCPFTDAYDYMYDVSDQYYEDYLFPQGDYMTCPGLMDAEFLDYPEFTRRQIAGAYSSYIKGMYRELENPISEECMGDWMLPVFDNLANLWFRFVEDPFDISYEEASQAAQQIVDLRYKTVEQCQFQKIGDDIAAWCLESPEKCLRADDMTVRLMNEAPAIFSAGFDIFEQVKQDKTCYTDEEFLDSQFKIVEDWALLNSHIYGFDLKWDQTVEQRHYTRSEFEIEMADAIAFGDFFTPLASLIGWDPVFYDELYYDGYFGMIWDFLYPILAW